MTTNNKGLTLEEIYNYLCWHDKRHPLYMAMIMPHEEEIQQPRINCLCDNCFYGRDKLAMEILRLLEKEGHNTK